MDYMQWNMIATWLIQHFAVQFSGKQRNRGCQYAEWVKSIKILQRIVHVFFLRLQVAEIVNDCALIGRTPKQIQKWDTRKHVANIIYKFLEILETRVQFFWAL